MQITIVRHGETNHNIAKIIQGSLDTELNVTGRQQAEDLALRFRGETFDYAYCSDLKRCRQTLAPIKAQVTKKTVYTELLRERYMAELQGISKVEVDRLCKKAEKTRFDFGESSQALETRALKFWTHYVQPLEGNGQVHSILICSHGGTLLHLVSLLVRQLGYTTVNGVSIKRPSPNTGVTILNTKTKTIEIYADSSHLSSSDRGSEHEVVDA